VLARDHVAGAFERQRRIVAGERGDGSVGAVLRRRQQPERAPLVVVRIFVIRVLHEVRLTRWFDLAPHGEFALRR
jgi:hypothetical protein